jgi:hypothetical protein
MADEENVGGMKMKRSPEEQFKRALDWNTKQREETLIKFASLAQRVGLMSGELHAEFYGYITSNKKGDKAKAIRLITEVAREVQPKIGAREDGGAIGDNTLARLDQYDEKTNPIAKIARGETKIVRSETLEMVPTLIIGKRPKTEKVAETTKQKEFKASELEDQFEMVSKKEVERVKSEVKATRWNGTVAIETKQGVIELTGYFDDQTISLLQRYNDTHQEKDLKAAIMNLHTRYFSSAATERGFVELKKGTYDEESDAISYMYGLLETGAIKKKVTGVTLFKE